MISNPRFIVGRKVESCGQQIIRAIFSFLTHSQQSTVNSQQSRTVQPLSWVGSMRGGAIAVGFSNSRLMRRSICSARAVASTFSTALTRNTDRPSKRTVTRSSWAPAEFGVIHVIVMAIKSASNRTDRTIDRANRLQWIFMLCLIRCTTAVVV